LAGLMGSKAANAAWGVPGDQGQQLCDSTGSCNVQETLVYTEASSNFLVPYRGYSSIPMKQNTAHSNYNSLQASLRHSFSHGLTLQAAYTWSHALDNSSSTYSSGAPASVDDQDLNRWYGTSDFNRFQVLQINYIYALPFFKNASNAFEKQALGGWQVSGITSFFTGEPMNFSCGVTGYATGIGTTPMCDAIGKVAPTKGVYNDPTYGPTEQWWNPATVTQPLFSQMFANGEACTFGCMGRGVLEGPGRNNWDIALQKNFALPWFRGEHSTMQFRFETFNTWNHPQWQGANSGCPGTTGFGQACNLNTTNPGEVNSDWGARVIQLGAKFLF
jgi:hypothetical protein